MEDEDDEALLQMMTETSATTSKALVPSAATSNDICDDTMSDMDLLKALEQSSDRTESTAVVVASDNALTCGLDEEKVCK